MENKIEIVEYSPALKKYFEIINYEWIQKYFSILPLDEWYLLKPEESVLAKEGYIFFVSLNDEIAGNAALLKIENEVYELAKMGVFEKFQGKGIGHKLLQHSIAKAKEMNLKKLILYSHTKLETAIHLYRKYGFVEVPMEEQRHYMRTDIKMELTF